MVTIVQGATKKPISAQRLSEFFIHHPKYEGFLYIGYPIIGTAEGPYPIDALLVSVSVREEVEWGAGGCDCLRGADEGGCDVDCREPTGVRALWPALPQ